MNDHYEPASDFLKAVISDDVPLSGSAFGDANFRRLIAMTSDADKSNRDWATLLLSQQDSDTTDVRLALLRAAEDEDQNVRAEAILGLAQRDWEIALPFIISALAGDYASMPLFEAAAIVADPSLLDVLGHWIEPSDDPFLDGLAQDAFDACAKGRSIS
jgi:HEAT repeat protein